MRKFISQNDKNFLVSTPAGTTVFCNGVCECDGELADFVAKVKNVVEVTPVAKPAPAAPVAPKAQPAPVKPVKK